MKKILRYIAILPASTLAWVIGIFLGGIISMITMSYIGLGPSGFNLGLFYTAGEANEGISPLYLGIIMFFANITGIALMVATGCAVAPAHKKVIGWSLYGLAVAYNIVHNIPNFWGWQCIGIILSIIASAFIVYDLLANVFEES